MRKRVCAILLLLMLAATSLLCGATEENIKWPKELLSSLGDCSFYDSCDTSIGEQRKYHFSDAREFYFIANVYTQKEYENSSGDIEIYGAFGGMMIYKFPPNVVDLRTDEGIVWESWQGDLQQHLFFIRNCCYAYNTDGELLSITIRLSDCWVEIEARSDTHPGPNTTYLPSYPQEGPETMLSRLLDPTKAPDAIAELTARAEGEYKEPEAEPDFEWTSIGWAIASGAVATMATWLATYLVMRKKAKKAPRLGGNDEILTAACGEAVSAEVLPQEDSKTDDFDRP